MAAAGAFGVALFGLVCVLTCPRRRLYSRARTANNEEDEDEEDESEGGREGDEGEEEEEECGLRRQPGGGRQMSFNNTVTAAK